MGFYAEVQRNYGERAYSMLRNWARNNIKLASSRNRRIFLLQCKNNGLRPKHIIDRIGSLFATITDSQSGDEVDRSNIKVIQRILLLEIKITVKRIHRLEKESSRLWQSLEGALPGYMLSEFKSRQIVNYNRHFHKIKEINTNKFNRLKDEQLKRLKIGEKWFKNISDIQIPNNVASFLSLGPKFSVEIPKNHVSIGRLLASVDHIIEKNSDENKKNILRSQTTVLITNYLNKTPNITNFLQKMFFESQRFLKLNPDLLVLQSDKGNVTVAMKRDDYVRLSEDLLNDEKYYKVLNKDPTLTIQNKTNDLIKNLLLKNEYITPEKAKKLYNYNSIPAFFYGLPKIHKPTLSLRPIVSSINTPTTKLSIFIAEILTKSIDNENDKFFIKDAFQFSELINNFQLPENYVLVSLDVVSLYSNIPIDLVTEVIETNWENITIHTKIKKQDFLLLVRFVFESSFFTFNNRLYSLMLGCPMGSNLSPIVARLTMDFVLHNILDRLTFDVPFIKKYVDDIICAIPSNKVDETLEIFNNFHPNIQFTIEKETNNTVPFLDTLLIRTPENSVILDWYRKPMSSDRYIHYLSNHPTRQKINLVLALKNRIKKICHPSLYDKNLKKLKSVLSINGYPEHLLHRLLFNTTDIHEPRQQRDQDDINNITYLSLPIIGELTSRLIQTLKTDNVKIAKKNEFTNKKIFSKVKDSLSKEKKSDVVYSVPCEVCGMVYVGQTSQQLKKRLIQHKSDIKNPNKKCALAEHCRKLNHTMKFDETKILEVEPTYRKRCFLEMFHIKKCNNSMNSKADIQGISGIYSHLIEFTNR